MIHFRTLAVPVFVTLRPEYSKEKNYTKLEDQYNIHKGYLVVRIILLLLIFNYFLYE